MSINAESASTIFAVSINQQPVSVAALPTDRLSDVLRDKLGMIATKIGCNAGDCGACTVLINGETACACLTPIAQVNGCSIETAEGLSVKDSESATKRSANDATLSRLQESFLQHGAAQCGICTPGMLMTAKVLLNDTPKPTRTEVEDALGGVLCRCTGYQKIIDAVVNTHQFTAETIVPAVGEVVGARIRHLDGRAKVTGELTFGADVIPEGALAVRVIRSPHHFAHFTLGDLKQYINSNTGIEAVLDASDIPGNNCFGVIQPFADQPVFAEGFARYRGEAIAAIVGAPDHLSLLDEADFPVEWEVLKHALLPEEALSESALAIHESRAGNVLIRGYVEHGDATAALARAKHRVSVKTTTPFIEHGYIEPEAGYCVRKGERLEIYGCTQAPQMDRESLAEIMGMGMDAIRIKPSACGGGFGSKLDISFQPYLALAAWKLDKPVTVCYSRGESMRSTTKRHPSDINLTVGCDDEGIISGFAFNGTFNTGAYASWGPTVANRVPVHASGPYYIEDYRADSVAVHTNTPPSGAFRGFGVPQSAIAQETAFDQLADKVGMDRLEFRIKNALRNGQPTATGQVFERGVGIVECLEVLQPAWERANQAAAQFNQQQQANQSPLLKGVGLGSCWYGCGNTSLPNPSTVRMGITRKGKVVLHQGAMDIGQGSNTVITQIAADSLGVAVHSIELIDADTDLTPDCGKTSASRQTYVSGMAAKLSGEALRATLLESAGLSINTDASIICHEGTVTVDGDGKSLEIDLSELKINEFGYVFMAQETYDPPTKALDEKGQGVPYAVYGYGAQLMELTVDTELGTIKLNHITTAHDVGRAINPMLVEGQIEGGVAQGIGMALMEEYLPGRTENLHDYLMPTFGDMPNFTHNIIEVEDAEGPYGAKGLGEHVLIPTAPAILNAIRDATGATVTNLPATPDKVLTAINASKQVGAA